MPGQRCEHGVDVALDVVGVGRDAEVAVPLRGDDPVRRRARRRAPARRSSGCRRARRAAPESRGVTTTPPSSSTPGDQPLVQAVARAPASRRSRSPRSARCRRCPRRSPAPAACPTRTARRRRRRVVVDVHLEDVPVGEPARLRRARAPRRARGRHQRKPSPAEASRYFEHARAEEVDPERRGRRSDTSPIAW